MFRGWFVVFHYDIFHALSGSPDGDAWTEKPRLDIPFGVILLLPSPSEMEEGIGE